MDLQGSSLLACPSGWRVPCSLSLMCVPLPAWTSLVLCFVPSATHCPMTIHVATENGWESKPRGSEEVAGEIDFPRSLPTPQTHPDVFFTCRMRTGLNSARGWESARAWNHPSRPDRPPSSHQPSGSCCEAQSGLGALRSAPPTSPCRSTGPQPTTCPEQAGAVGAVRSGPQAILCPK